MHCYSLWLAKRCQVTLWTNQKKNQNQLWLACTRFPTLGAGYMYLLQVLICSLNYLHVLWLVRVITLVLILQHSIENFSFPESHKTCLQLMITILLRSAHARWLVAVMSPCDQLMKSWSNNSLQPLPSCKYCSSILFLVQFGFSFVWYSLSYISIEKNNGKSKLNQKQNWTTT